MEEVAKCRNSLLNPPHTTAFHLIAVKPFYAQREFVVPITFSIKIKIKHIYVGIPGNEYPLLNYLSQL
jgi:hypothetical protein